MRKKLGDRRDGTRLKSGGFEKIWNCLKAKRSENEVHMLKEIDVTELKKYYDDKKINDEKLTEEEPETEENAEQEGEEEEE